MPTTHPTSILRLGVALAVCAFALPVAGAQARVIGGDSSSGAAAPSQDLRSPDARDAALGYDPPVPAFTPGPVTSTPDSERFDWSSALIGAGVLGLLGLMLVGAAATARRRRGHVGA